MRISDWSSDVCSSDLFRSRASSPSRRSASISKPSSPRSTTRSTASGVAIAPIVGARLPHRQLTAAHASARRGLLLGLFGGVRRADPLELGDQLLGRAARMEIFDSPAVEAPALDRKSTRLN